ncbi:hypothetical protein BHE90_016442 [Fusarium euwallaceae]|uniref:Uncharacterized protein n=2 Tax=Fusarium solani species complex TaxID=232080 RepID=A0A428TEC6_9HYPO|nr:hypothetical protein CEP52_009166 [Fusarium oligoseptatum]RTE69179.1 hypothetical protein BHE90_016442 [Fusarium euwallaceae]
MSSPEPEINSQQRGPILKARFFKCFIGASQRSQSAKQHAPSFRAAGPVNVTYTPAYVSGQPPCRRKPVETVNGVNPSVHPPPGISALVPARPPPNQDSPVPSIQITCPAAWPYCGYQTERLHQLRQRLDSQTTDTYAIPRYLLRPSRLLRYCPDLPTYLFLLQLPEPLLSSPSRASLSPRYSTDPFIVRPVLRRRSIPTTCASLVSTSTPPQALHDEIHCHSSPSQHPRVANPRHRQHIYEKNRNDTFASSASTVLTRPPISPTL